MTDHFDPSVFASAVPETDLASGVTSLRARNTKDLDENQLVAGIPVENGALEEGMLERAVGVLAIRTLAPIAHLSQIFFRWQNIQTSLGALGEIMGALQDRAIERRHVRKPVLSGQIEFGDIKFSHAGSKAFGFNVESLKISGGGRVSLLGENGSGKFLLLRRIVRKSFCRCRILW